MQDLRVSDIREILKVTQQPDVISFAGGLPASELLPAVEMAELARKVLLEDGVRALQYAPTEGLDPLRELIANRLRHLWGIQPSMEEVLIVGGSQQALDLTGKVFLDEGDIVLCESPTYLGAIGAFRAYRPEFVEVPTDDDGMVPVELESRLSSLDRVKLIYVVPDFQNPSGRRWSIERRYRLAELAGSYGVPVIEDAPYAELCFEGEPIPPVATLGDACTVVYLGTCSKILSPGIRLGWVVADSDLVRRYVLVKQGTDLHTSSLVQLIAARFMLDHDLEAHIARIRRVYRARRDAMLAALEEHFPEDISFTRPAGGLFLWVELPEGMDARSLLERTLEERVAFVPGESFFPNGGHENTFRLNFSAMPEERITEGIARLGKVLASVMTDNLAAV
jgi:DNA-binding transcriptional MocR family regulator